MTHKSTLLQYSNINKKSMNLSELRIWKTLKGSEYNFRRQKPIGNFIVDFVSLRKKIIIEIDGRSHDEKTEYDKFRTKYLNELGYKLLIIQRLVEFPTDAMQVFIFKELEELISQDKMVKVI